MGRKEKYMHVLTVRHLEDENAVKSFGLDAPLKRGQEDRAAEIAREIELFAHETGKSRVAILYPGNKRRTTQTVQMIAKNLQLPVRLQIECGLYEPEQGTPVLPEGYKDGERLSALDSAWDAFCDEAYVYRNVDYHFGQAAGFCVYPELEGKFSRLGEPLAVFVARQFEFLSRLFSESLVSEDELLVLCTHSITSYTLLELQAIAEDVAAGMLQLHPEELPFLCWQYFKKAVQERYPDDHAFGKVLKFDLSNLLTSPVPDALVQSGKIFEERKMISPDSIQGKINSSSNDYSGLDKQFQALTGRMLDASEPLPDVINFEPISIVVPYYKSGSTIVKLLDAVEGQDLSADEIRQVEVVIVDDGSKDSLSEILQGHKYFFELNVVTLEQNCGRSAARNAGAVAARHNILMFLDSDILLTRHCVREHAVRNALVPGQLYTSLIDNINNISEVKAGSENHSGLPEPPVYREYRTKQLVPAWQMGLYPVSQDCTIRIMAETDNFRNFGFGRRVSIYDLPCMFATYVVSLDKQLFQRIGGFSLEFQGWGMEDTFFGAVGIALGAKVIPVLSAGGYHVAHTPRSGSDEAWAREFQKNIDLYKKLVSLPL